MNINRNPIITADAKFQSSSASDYYYQLCSVSNVNQIRSNSGTSVVRVRWKVFRHRCELPTGISSDNTSDYADRFVLRLCHIVAKSRPKFRSGYGVVTRGYSYCKSAPHTVRTATYMQRIHQVHSVFRSCERDRMRYHIERTRNRFL